MRIRVKKDYVQYLQKFCSVEETRRFLMGINFDFAEKSLCATDGHRLAYISENGFETDCKSGNWEKIPALIIQFHLPSIKKLSKKLEYLDLDVNLDSLKVKLESGETIGMIIEGNFPPFKHLFPKEGTEEKIDCIGINPDLLKDFYVKKVVSVNHVYYEGGVKLTFYGKEKAVKVDVINLPEIKGLIMPMRIKEK